MEDYDHDRLAQALTGEPPDVIQAEVTERKAGGVLQRVEFAVRPGTGDLWVSVSFENVDDPASMQFLVLGERAYLRGETGEETIDWITGPSAGGLEIESVAADFTPSASLADAPLMAVAVEACGEVGFCFVLENPDDPSRLLLVDTESYVPVAIRNMPDNGDAAGSQINLIWGGEFDFSPPDGAVEVEADEIGTALFVLLLALARTETSGAEAAPPDTGSEGRRGSRAKPLPAGSTIEANGFSIEILDALRGDAALDNVLAASDFNDPPTDESDTDQRSVRPLYIRSGDLRGS